MAQKYGRAQSIQDSIADEFRRLMGENDNAKELASSIMDKAKNGNTQAQALAMKYIAGDPKDFSRKSDDQVLIEVVQRQAKTTIEICPHCGKNVTHAPSGTVEEDEAQVKEARKEAVKIDNPTPV